MDNIDVRLVTLLQESGRISQNELAHAVGLSAPAVAERLRKLEDRGVIRQYTALVDPRRIGLETDVMVAGELDRLPEYQNIAVNVDRLFAFEATLKGEHVRSSLGRDSRSM